VLPALNRQAECLRQALARTNDDAGCWRLPDGADYYAFAVRSFTTTSRTGEEIHRIGTELVATLQSRADALLRARGLTRGGVADRLRELRARPSQRYPNTDDGRAAMLADVQRAIDAMDARLPKYFGTLPRLPLRVQRTPPAAESGAPGGTYQQPAADGSRPGLLQVNLRSPADEWPKLDVPTFVYHETLPGHHLQNALQLQATDLAMLRRLPLFSGYLEGWGLYAEQLADEMGAYDDDPDGRIGYVASLLFRAARLVVDSGLHAKRWTRDQAIDYMQSVLGEARTVSTREVERYCVQPGQACSYALGHQAWLAARDAAKRRLGASFDLRAFHDHGLLAGVMPLDALAEHYAGWHP
jgi:uncharacterized protein (DUF885 family)